MTTPTTTKWREERADHLARAKNVVSRAKAAGRDLTPTEAATVDSAVAQVKDLDAKIKGAELVKSVLSLGTAEHNPDAPGGVFSETAREGIVHAVKSRTTYRTEVNRKALTSGTLLPTSGTGVAAGLHPNLFPIASLFREEPATGPTMRYYRLDGATADVVAEGALKPDAGVTVTPVDVVLAKIATRCQFSDEMAEDAGFLISYLQGELTSAVIVRENRAILDTLAGTSGVLTATGPAGTVVDVIADVIAGQEALNGVAPSAVIAHPTVVSTIRKAKAETAGSYVVDPLAAAPAALHGVRLISTPATAPGTVWVAGGQAAVIYRRGGVTAEIGHSTDDFSRNLRTLVVEERMATAVVRPSALTKVTLT